MADHWREDKERKEKGLWSGSSTKHGPVKMFRSMLQSAYYWEVIIKCA